ncbi:MAG: hypothetical protein FJ318_07715 [SAR202 cluster bacterium]|nr:hypothetical protein [SAR202 cluster bacterium]
MSRVPGDSQDGQLSMLPGERFEIGLDSQRGALTAPPPPAADAVVVTSHRAVRMGAHGGRRTTAVVTLASLSGVEVIDATRPGERLTQGLTFLAIGAALAVVTWTLFGQPLITLLFGGIPVLLGVYALTAYAFPDTDGELVLHAGAFALRQPLLSENARRDAHLVAHRVYELLDEARGPAAPPPPQPPASVAVPAASLRPIENKKAEVRMQTPRADADPGPFTPIAPTGDAPAANAASAHGVVPPAASAVSINGVRQAAPGPFTPQATSP